MTPFIGRAGISTHPFHPLLEEARVKGKVKVERNKNLNLTLFRGGKRVRMCNSDSKTIDLTPRKRWRCGQTSD
jgi:hypothetical protein